MLEYLYPKNMEHAKEIQELLAPRVVCQDQFGPLSLFGGMDVSYNRFDPAQMIFAASVVVDAQGKLVESSTVADKQTFPYRTGFLGFRESPPLLKAYESLQKKPDIMLVDGQGICHPRGLGIASHIGVLLDVPTIGVGKSLLIGKPEGELSPVPGSTVPLVWKGKKVGMLLRSKKNAQPLIISSGHRVSLKTAVDIVIGILRGYRLPEPTRLAHLIANECRRDYFSQVV